MVRAILSLHCTVFRSSANMLILIVIALLLSGCNSRVTSDNQVSRTLPISRPTSVPTPSMIAPAVWPGTPIEQASAAAAAFAAEKPLVRMPALVGALGASGVPVVDSKGQIVAGTGSDYLGLPWMHVSGIAVTNPQFSISFADAARLLDLGLTSIPAADSGKAARLLAAVREGLSSPDPQVQFFAHLIAHSNARLGGPPLILSSTTPEQVRIDMATLEVFVGRMLRLALVEALRIKANQPVADRGKVSRARVISFNPLLIQTSYADDLIKPIVGTNETKGMPSIPEKTTTPPPNCADDAMNGWGIWVLSKALGGVDMSAIGGESAAWKGLTDWVSKEIIQSGEAIMIDASKLTHATEFLNYFGGLMSSTFSALNYLFELAMLHATVTMEGGEPLVRHKRKSEGDGEAKILVAKVEMKMPDSARGDSNPETDAAVVSALNCLLALGTALGNNTFMPTEGPQSGLRIDVSGGTGFTRGLAPGDSIVLFGPATFKPYQDTDVNGEIRIPVQGRRQKRDYSDDAKPVKKEFGVILTSTLEPTDGASVGKTFLDSLICVGAVGLGCADAITDILKTFHYSLGEHTFALRDWQSNKKHTFNNALLKLKYTNENCRDTYTYDISGSTCGDPVPGDWKINQKVTLESACGSFTHRHQTIESFENDCVLEGSDDVKFFESVATSVPKGGSMWYCIYRPAQNSQSASIIIRVAGNDFSPVENIVPLLEEEECSE